MVYTAYSIITMEGQKYLLMYVIIFFRKMKIVDRKYYLLRLFLFLIDLKSTFVNYFF